MIQKIRDIIRSLLEVILYGSKRCSNSYIQYLRKQGVEIGEGTIFYEPLTNVIDATNPRMLTIGENVRITRGVVILTHDYSWSVLAGVYGECLGGIAPVTIGNNVFIGMDAHILKGVTIGDNVIIGAGSVITCDCESNSVYAGNPARKLMTLDDYYKKKKGKCIHEAREITRKHANSTLQEKQIALREFCALYSTTEDPQLRQLIKDTGYEEKCTEFYSNRIPPFENLEAFVNNCNSGNE